MGHMHKVVKFKNVLLDTYGRHGMMCIIAGIIRRSEDKVNLQKEFGKEEERNYRLYVHVLLTSMTAVLLHKHCSH